MIIAAPIPICRFLSSWRADGRFVPGRMVRASDFKGDLNEKNNPEWKTVCFDEETDQITVPTGSIGFRWGEEGKWNIVPTDAKTGKYSPAQNAFGRA
jgi:nitrate reductase alpha subunit